MVVRVIGDAQADRAAGFPDVPITPFATLPGFVLGKAAERGTKPALIDAATGRELSYAELANSVLETGSGMAAQGVRAGDVLALCAPNSVEFAVAWFAAASIGAVVATLNPQWTEREVARQFRQTKARWLTATADHHARLLPVVRDANIAGTFVIGEPVPGTVSFSSLRLPGALPGPAPCPSDVALLLSSSGTTGLPKSVVLSHRNLVANLCQMRLAHRLTADDVVITALPLFHIFGLQVTLDLALLEGATVVVVPRFEQHSFLHAVQDYKVTRAEVVPPIVLALARLSQSHDYDLSSLRLITSGAAPLGADLARACARAVGCRVKQAYGMTELAGGSHIPPDGPDSQDRPESIGPALPGVECRVVELGTGDEASPGTAGELLIRSPSTMWGYLDDPDATAAAIDAEGWLHTGDIVTCDADGWFRVTDRVKELIKCNGYAVAPAELEAVLLAHPAVADAAVVRSPDLVSGEVPKAYVVLRDSITDTELMAWVAERVAPYKRVRRVEVTDAIPKSPAGKILRRLLAERDASRMSAHASGGTGEEA
jgi:acyl-CoA synthetase (AMP-forming)/AMP-acid ligase II